MGICVPDMYVKDVTCKITVSDQEPEILNETPASAWVDGNNVLGKTCFKKNVSSCLFKRIVHRMVKTRWTPSGELMLDTILCIYY